MSTEIRTWLAAIGAGLIACGVGIADAFGNHSAFLSSQGDLTLILGGIGLIAGKGVFDAGVSVLPTPKP